MQSLLSLATEGSTQVRNTGLLSIRFLLVQDHSLLHFVQWRKWCIPVLIDRSWRSEIPLLSLAQQKRSGKLTALWYMSGCAKGRMFCVSQGLCVCWLLYETYWTWFQSEVYPGWYLSMYHFKYMHMCPRTMWWAHFPNLKIRIIGKGSVTVML